MTTWNFHIWGSADSASPQQKIFYSLPFLANQRCQASKRTLRLFRTTRPTWNNRLTLEVPMKRIFLFKLLVKLSKLWRMAFYCDSTLGCQVIQDFDLCKLDYLWRHFVATGWCKIKKKLNISHNFFCIELKLSTVVTLITKFHDMSTVTFPWQHTGLQALSIQRCKITKNWIYLTTFSV